MIRLQALPIPPPHRDQRQSQAQKGPGWLVVGSLAPWTSGEDQRSTGDKGQGQHETGNPGQGAQAVANPVACRAQRVGIQSQHPEDPERDEGYPP